MNTTSSADLDAQIEQMQLEMGAFDSENESLVEQTVNFKEQQRVKDQSKIALVIIWTFVGMIAAIFVMVIAATFLEPASGLWTAPASFLFKILSQLMLPVVTLVLGYYFGMEKNAG